MSHALSDLAHLIGGTLHGSGDVQISGTATINAAREGDITLANNPKLAAQLSRCKAAAVVVSPNFSPTGFPYIEVADVHAAFALIVRHFRPKRQSRPIGISDAAHVSLTAKIGPHVEVYPGAFIGDHVEIGEGAIIHSGVRILDGCRIGAGTTIFPNAVLYENSVVGCRTIIHANSVLGAYGFGYSMVDGKHKLSAQLGYVEVGNDVEIGACSTIDRGTYGPTIVGDGCKFDNHVMIGHNARIGKHNLICSQAGVAGSSTTGDYVVMAGQVGIRDHVHVGDGAIIGAKAGVMNDIPAGHRVVGIPAIEEKEQYLVWAAMYKLPAMRKKLIELERELTALSAGQGGSSASNLQASSEQPDPVTPSNHREAA